MTGRGYPRGKPENASPVGEDGHPMTDLLTDVLGRSHRSGRGSGPATGTAARSLTSTGALAGAGAALLGLVLCMAVAITGWFLADAGAHGETTDALRVGADAWLMGHAAGLTFSGAPLGIVPLGLTAVLLLVAFRTGRWSGATAVRADQGGADQGRADRGRADRGRAGDAPGVERSLVAAGGSYLLAYGVVVVLAWVLSSTEAVSTSLGRGLLGAAGISLLAGVPGIAVGAGVVPAVLDRLPSWVRLVGYGAATGALVLVAAAAALVAGSLAVHLTDAATVISTLHLGVGDALMLTVVTALVAPTFVFLAVAYLVGPGFAVGTGTSVTTTAVSLGALPAFPALAALPAEGAAPGWARLLVVVPFVAGAIGACLAQRRADDAALDLAALRGAGAGVVAGVLVTLAVVLAGGPMGTGRMADIGAPGAKVLALACGGMGVGGMLAGLVTAWWQRRGHED
jgi:hypothetical protein